MMKLTKQQAQSAVYDDSDMFESVERQIIDTSRWSNIYSGVFKHIDTGKFYEVCWSEGATECQEEEPFEYDSEVEFKEVQQVEKTIKVWEAV